MKKVLLFILLAFSFSFANGQITDIFKGKESITLDPTNEGYYLKLEITYRKSNKIILRVSDIIFTEKTNEKKKPYLIRKFKNKKYAYFLNGNAYNPYNNAWLYLDGKLIKNNSYKRNKKR